jgi:hypothetical protein
MSPQINFKKASRVAGGVGLIAVGIPMLVLPGPGVISILGGVALLSSEYAWARGVSDWAQQKRAALLKRGEARPPDADEDEDDQTG